MFRRSASAMAASCSPLQPFGPSGIPSPPMPSADSSTAVRESYDPLSPDPGKRRRPPGVSPAAFRAQPPDLRFAPLMELDFALSSPLVRRSRNPIYRTLHRRVLPLATSQLAEMGPSVAVTGPCASLTLHLHQVG